MDYAGEYDGQHESSSIEQYKAFPNRHETSSLTVYPFGHKFCRNPSHQSPRRNWPKNLLSLMSIIASICPIVFSSSIEFPTTTSQSIEVALSVETTTLAFEYNSSFLGFKRSLPELDISDCFVTFKLVSGHYLIDPPYKVVGDTPPGKCLSSCLSDSKCRSVNIDYKRGTCEYLAATMDVSNEYEISTLKASNSQNYFEKICLKNITNFACPSERYWSIEMVKGKILSGIPFKKTLIKEAKTKDQCQSACISYEDFVCRSAEFNNDKEECRIYPFNRFSIENDPNVKLDVTSEDIDYFENNCVREAKGFCNTKGMKEQRQLLSERILVANSLHDCQNECLSNEAFTCRSFTYESETKTCSLSHHTTKSQVIVRSPLHVYYEISACYEVSVDCEPDFMRINVRSNLIFQGKIYTRERPSSCIVDVSNSMDFTLPVQLMGDECATTREGEGKFNNVLVIQANDLVVTSMDKAVGVTCNYDVGNKTTIGETSLTINDVALFVEERKLTAPLPGLSLHIVDSKGLEKDIFSLGEVLRVQVRMSDENTYGIFVRNMIAKDATGFNNLTLIDHSGCPGEAKMMREVRTIDDSSKSLESYFEAFSFTGSSTLNLEAEVETCLDRCRPVRCEAVSGRSEDEKSLDHVYSMGRRKRSVDNETAGGEVIEATTLVKKIRIQSPDLGIVSLSSDEDKSYVGQFAVQADREKGDRKKGDKKKGSNRTSTGRRSKSTGSKIIEGGNSLMYKVDNEGYYCFGPNSLTLISGVIIFIQTLLFTLALVITSRGRIKFSSCCAEKQSSHLSHNLSSHLFLPNNSKCDPPLQSVSRTRATSIDSRINFVY